MSELTQTFPLTPPANPGASSVGLIFDTSLATTENASDIATGRARREYKRCRVVVFVDQADAVFRVRWAENATGTLRTFSSTTIAINTAKDFDVLLQPGRTVIDIVTVTAPTVWQVAADLVRDQSKSS